MNRSARWAKEDGKYKVVTHEQDGERTDKLSHLRRLGEMINQVVEAIAATRGNPKN